MASITTRRPSRSISRTTSSMIGIKCSRPSPRTTQTSFRPVENVSSMVPSARPSVVTMANPCSSKA